MANGTPATDPAASGKSLGRLDFSGRTTLTTRVLLVNLVPLIFLAGTILYLDFYRRQLLDERFKLALSEAQITAEALAGATPERQQALLIQIGKEQRLRLRMYDANGRLKADSFALDEPSFRLTDPATHDWEERLALNVDSVIDTLAGAGAVEPYVEPEGDDASDWPELDDSRRDGVTQIRLRRAPDRTPVITAAAPVGLDGETLLTTRNAIDITESVREARALFFALTVAAFLMSIAFALYLARTIIQPLRQLVAAAQRVRLGRDREVEVPRLPARRDEIGLMARALSDMTAALRDRIDAGETFAADVAHEIKNPLASLRSAVESLGRVEDPELRSQLTDVAAHDVRRIDRLITEIADASRIEAEMTRAPFETVDMLDLVQGIVGARAHRHVDGEVKIEIVQQAAGPFRVNGIALRLERVIENLLDNAVSFSPPDGTITISLDHHGSQIGVRICDEGPGVPDAAREKIFRRFHSLRPETEDFGDHSGLGLAIARNIAQAHDGTLAVSDRPDGQSGACFTLRLPALPAASTAS
jgi:two-component system sensor histidine kinase ChvG